MQFLYVTLFFRLLCFYFILFIFIFLMFIPFWEREGEKSEQVQAGEGQRERDTESEAGARFLAVSTEPNTGLEPISSEIMTWAKVWCSTDWATQAPLKFLYLLRERARECRRGAERQRESQAGSISPTVRSWPQLKSGVRRLMTKPPRCPTLFIF